jgi:hypothetical protein
MGRGPQLGDRIDIIYLNVGERNRNIALWTVCYVFRPGCAANLRSSKSGPLGFSKCWSRRNRLDFEKILV